MPKIHMQPYPLFAACLYKDSDVTVGRVIGWVEDPAVEEPSLVPLITSWSSGHGAAEVIADAMYTHYASSPEKAEAGAKAHASEIEQIRRGELG